MSYKIFVMLGLLLLSSCKHTGSSGSGLFTMNKKRFSYMYKISIKEAEQAFDPTAQSDFTRTLMQARMMPLIDDGVPYGYEFIQVKDNSIFEKIGIHKGVKIVGIESYYLNRPSDLPEFSWKKYGKFAFDTPTSYLRLFEPFRVLRTFGRETFAVKVIVFEKVEKNIIPVTILVLKDGVEPSDVGGFKRKEMDFDTNDISSSPHR